MAVRAAAAAQAAQGAAPAVAAMAVPEEAGAVAMAATIVLSVPTTSTTMDLQAASVPSSTVQPLTTSTRTVRLA